MFTPTQHPFFRLQCTDNENSAKYVHTGVFSRTVDEYYNEYASGAFINVSICRFETVDALAFILYADGTPLLFTELTRVSLVNDKREQQAVSIIEAVHREVSPETLRVSYLTQDDLLPVTSL